MKTRLKSAADFAAQGHFPDEDLRALETVARRYTVGITPEAASTIKGSTATDPVARQYIPQMAELQILPEERTDPIGDDVHSPVKGIVHRYPDRVLFKPLNVCAVYCRYCFRREKVGPGAEMLSANDRKAALRYIREHKDIWEVILSGGDPLVLSARQLKDILDELESIPHVQVIRLHTRVPVANPARLNTTVYEALKRDKAVYIALHINHAQEITPSVKSAFKALQDAGCVLLSQSVLLKGVNDDAKALEELFRTLVALKVKPYYLHHGDLAPGTGHFRTTIDRGQKLMKQLLGRLSGLCQPHYMLDIPGGHGKIPIGPSYLEALENGHYMAEDYQGCRHHYPPQPEDE